jgi:hypothetical protein
MVSLFMGFFNNVTPCKQKWFAALIQKILTFVIGVFRSAFYFTPCWYIWSYYNMNECYVSEVGYAGKTIPPPPKYFLLKSGCLLLTSKTVRYFACEI